MITLKLRDGCTSVARLTESEDFDGQEKPGKSQSIGGLDGLLGDGQTVHAVSEVCCKGQDAQYGRWRHEHPGMVVKQHFGGEVMARGQSLCIGSLTIDMVGVSVDIYVRDMQC
jgi:hypothetical protein